MSSPPPNDESSPPAENEADRLLWADAAAERQSADAPEAPPPERFQFGIGSMLVLTTVCAVLLALGSVLDLPRLLNPLFGLPKSLIAFLVCVFFLFTVYGVLRLPWIIRRFERARVRQREIQLERERLVRSLTRNTPIRPDAADDGPGRDEPLR